MRGVNEAGRELERLLSLPEEEQIKYIDEIKELLNLVKAHVEHRLREEPILVLNLKERLVKEGWRITAYHPGKQHGCDLSAEKEKDNAKRAIIIEAKGEPGLSAKSRSGQRRKTFNDALGDITHYMQSQSSDVCYCIALPDTYLPVVADRLPAYVREKLNLYILFLSGNSLTTLCPTLEREIDLRAFDDLFENDCLKSS